MVDGPNVHDVDAEINIELFIGDPNTGLGLSGQASFTEVTIQRDSDLRYWTGTAWSATRTTLTPTEVDGTNQKGRYTTTLPASGNTSADRYVVHTKVNNPPTVEGEDYEVHISRSTAVRVYESEPV